MGAGLKTLSAINTTQQMITLYPGFEEITLVPFIVGVAPANIVATCVAVHRLRLAIGEYGK